MENLIEIQIILKCKYGDFYGKRSSVTEEQYSKVLELSKKFYLGGFELTCEDDSFVIFPPDIISDSVLRIIKIK